MITNERQYKITKTQLTKLREAIESFDMGRAVSDAGDKALGTAQLQALESEREVLADQLREYETLRSGAVENLEAYSLNELPDLLVRARIASGFSQKQLAGRLGLKEQQIQRYEAERYASASLRRLIEVSDSLGLKISKRARLQAKTGERTLPRSEELDWDKFPFKEMYRRAWFDGFSGSLREAEVNASALLGNFMKSVGAHPLEALYRKHVRTDSNLDQYSLLAWQCRILRLADRETTTATFRKSLITSTWLRKLAKLSKKNNGPRLAKEYLRASGITLVVEPHLPQTYLDGAALLISREKPVIGVTLRYDRLDNFWFVLFHELAHLVLHLGKGDDQRFFDDLDAKPDDLECEADEFAGEALVPKKTWETSVARYVQSVESVSELAGQLEISPAIVAGRIRRESDNYMIFPELIGSGEVRRQFPEVKFG
jgi:HTH-type transcriptional regulator/antitoxin HigA